MRDSVLNRIASIESELRQEEKRLRSAERKLYVEAMAADRQRQQEASSIVSDLHRQEQQRASRVAVDLQRQRRPQNTRAANSDYREQQRLAAIGPILQSDNRDTFVIEELVGVDTFEKSSALVSSSTGFYRYSDDEYDCIWADHDSLAAHRGMKILQTTSKSGSNRHPRHRDERPQTGSRLNRARITVIWRWSGVLRSGGVSCSKTQEAVQCTIDIVILGSLVRNKTNSLIPVDYLARMAQNLHSTCSMGIRFCIGLDRRYLRTVRCLSQLLLKPNQDGHAKYQLRGRGKK